MVFPVDQCGPKDKIKEGSVEDLFNLVPLPSLRNYGWFIWLRPYCRRSVGRECPRGIGEANERLSKHEVKEGQSDSDSFHTSGVIRPIKI